MSYKSVSSNEHLKLIDNKRNLVAEALLEDHRVEAHLAFAKILIDEIGLLVHSKDTASWDGSALHQLMDRQAAYETLMGRYELRVKNSAAALIAHEKAHITLSHQGKNGSTQIREENMFYHLRALAATGGSGAKRRSLYPQLLGLNSTFRFRAWLLTYFGSIGYMIDERFLARKS